MFRRSFLAALAASTAIAFPTAASAHDASHGSGTATVTDGLVHHRTFTLQAARRQAVRAERATMAGWPARIGRCHWRTSWEVACSVRFHGPIFEGSTAAATYTWTDLVAVNQRPLWPLIGRWSVQSVGLQQIGVIQL